LLAVISSWGGVPGQQAGLVKSGSKLPHSKTTEGRYAHPSQLLACEVFEIAG